LLQKKSGSPLKQVLLLLLLLAETLSFLTWHCHSLSESHPEDLKKSFAMLNCARRVLLPSYSQRWGFVYLWTPKRWRRTHCIW
jgi:hypothetical protein